MGISPSLTCAPRSNSGKTPQFVPRLAPMMEHRALKEDANSPPGAASWIRVRAGHLIEIGALAHHEHLEARLLLRDWLRKRGVELDVLERKL